MHSLVAFHDDIEFFHSDGPWLYPLLELEAALIEKSLVGQPIRIYDKIVGRAGALLAARLGVRHIETDLLSLRAVPVLEHHGITYTARLRVDRILCATEDLLEHELDPERGWQAINERIAHNRQQNESPASQPQEPILKTSNLKVFRDGRPVIHTVNLTVNAGDAVLIGGPNGAGKTTLLRAILGILTDTTGEILVMGNPVGSREWNSKRRSVAYVRQSESPTDLPITAREVVGIGAGAVDSDSRSADQRALEALQMVDAEDLANRQFGKLSGGERQRVSLARALAQQPRLLLMDEPTSGLDAASRTSLLQLLAVLPVRHNLGLIVVSHDIDPAELGRVHVYTLTDGTLAGVSDTAVNSGV